MGLAKYAFYGAVAGTFTFAAYLLIGEGTGAITYPCVKSVVVADILSIEYRSGSVLGVDGETYKWSSHVKVGDVICVKHQRKIDWTFSD